MRKRLFLFGLLCAGIHSQAQLTGFRREGDHIFEEALRSFEQQQNQHATDVLHQKNTLPYGREVSKQSIVWQWERALEYRAALRNRQTHAIGHLIQFAEQCQVLAIRSVLNMEAGRYYFRNGQYREAITCLEKTGIEYLTNTELVEKNFELGYSYLVIGRFDKVEPYFQTAKNIPGDFFKPGNYYHGLLSYYRGDYTAARSSFQAVAHDEPYQNLVPYYLIEMDYLEGHTNKALQDALQQLDAKGNLYYTRELKLLVATLYTDQKDYARAIPYYRDYLQAGDDSGASMENRFKLAWCLWKEKQESEALQILESLNGMPEALNTERGLMLASGYLKEKNMDRFESSIRELKADSNDVSMQAWLSFTRAQLASQQNKKEVTDMLEEHLSMFPSSPYTEQVHEMLSVWYIRESRFEEAARQMNELNQISVGLLTYYQQAMYRKAMDLLKQGEAEQAIPFFEEARKFSEDPAIPVLSDFWLSEACFRNQLYADANLAADRFLDAADNRTWPAYIQQAHLLKCFIFRQANDTANMLQQYQLAVHDTTSFHDTSFLFSLNRSLFQPDTLPEFNSYPITYSYEVPEHEVKVRYQPIPLKPLALQSKEEGKHLPSSFSLQAGNRRATDLQAHLNLDALLKWPLQVYVQHERITEVPNERQFRHTALQALSSYLLMDHEARFRVDFSNDAFRYWGMLGSETASARSFHTAAYRKMDAQLELLPLKPNIYQIDYQARIQNGLFFNRNGSTEYRLALETPARKVWNESTVFYANLQGDFNFFTSHTGSVSSSYISLRAAAEKIIKGFTLYTGISPTIAQRKVLLPDLEVSRAFWKDRARWMIVWKSKLQLNTYRELRTLNPFLLDFYTPQVSQHTEGYVGAVLNGYKNLSGFVHLGLAKWNQLPVFLNDTIWNTRQFVTLYEPQAYTFLLDAGAEYALGSDMRAGLNYSWRPLMNETIRERAWHYRPGILKCYIMYSPAKRWQCRGEFILFSGSHSLMVSDVPAYPVHLQSGVDLNLHATYQYSSRWLFTADVLNAFNSGYQRWGNYPQFGWMFRAGVRYAFHIPRML